MTKDELKKEVADWWKIKFRVELKDDICQRLVIDEVEELCNKIAEPREKQIAELEAQIEKMKCCENCEWKAKGVYNGNDTCGLKEWKLVETRR